MRLLYNPCLPSAHPTIPFSDYIIEQEITGYGGTDPWFIEKETNGWEFMAGAWENPTFDCASKQRSNTILRHVLHSNSIVDFF